MTLAQFARLAVTWDQFKPEMDKEGKVTRTHCNQFVAACAREMSCKELDNLNAEEIIGRIAASSRWSAVSAKEAQTAANNGFLVIAGADDPDKKGLGGAHICVLIPGGLIWSGIHNEDMPTVANVGKTNFYGRCASYAFPKGMKPGYWLWTGP